MCINRQTERQTSTTKKNFSAILNFFYGYSIIGRLGASIIQYEKTNWISGYNQGTYPENKDHTPVYMYIKYNILHKSSSMVSIITEFKANSE